MMDQTHVMYYYWQQPMVNTYACSRTLLIHYELKFSLECHS